jgi:hypothetical protein
MPKMQKVLVTGGAGFVWGKVNVSANDRLSVGGKN